MQEFSDKFNFKIILESEGVGEASTYWQKQFQMLYDSIRKNLPEGSIGLVSHKGEGNEKAIDILSYDTLSLAGITLSSFHVLLKLINVWERNRQKANVKLRAQNGSEFNLSNLSIDEALEIYRNLQMKDND